MVIYGRNMLWVIKRQSCIVHGIVILCLIRGLELLTVARSWSWRLQIICFFSVNYWKTWRFSPGSVLGRAIWLQIGQPIKRGSISGRIKRIPSSPQHRVAARMSLRWPRWSINIWLKTFLSRVRDICVHATDGWQCYLRILQANIYDAIQNILTVESAA
jgi:hypothetical protein